MRVPTAVHLTHLLSGVADSERAQIDRLVPALYEELRRLARRFLRGESLAQTLQTTELVHEAYIRLLEQKSVKWQNEKHLLAIAARLMRRILVDFARSRLAAKRGGSACRVHLTGELLFRGNRNIDLIEIDDALERLMRLDPRQARIVELRFFGGLTVEEIAELLRCSPASIKRDWTFAKAWLRREMAPT